MAFNDIIGYSQWRTIKSDEQIVTLAGGDVSDRFDQILDLLRSNKKFYIENGQTEDQWLDRLLNFGFQRSVNTSGVFSERYLQLDGTDLLILENGDKFILQNEPVLSVDYMNDKDSSWFNSDIRLNIGVKVLMNAVNEKGISYYSTATNKAPDGKLLGPSDSDVSSLSWLPSNYVSLYNKIIGLTYSKYTYITKLSNVHLRYSDPQKIFTEIDTENTTAISNLNTSQLTDLLTYVRETYVSRPDDDDYKQNVEAACEMLEFDMAQ
jgi:hypothetical protein